MHSMVVAEKNKDHNSVTKSILLIEDNHAVSTLLKYVLKAQGYKVSLSETIQDAQEILAAKLSEYDLILLDLNLPGGSGFDILNQLPEDNKVPIIIISALSQSQNIIRGLESGASDYITKPFDPKELIIRIERLL
ncbi:MAG TPA: response regulator transcription factor [Trueperaceae bacterium]|nr:response regulator transcription factor [Trueperaceae bacterium]